MVEINDLGQIDSALTETGWTEGQAPSTVNNSGRASLGVFTRYAQHTKGEGLTAVTETGVNSLSVSLARASLTNTASASGSTGYFNGLLLNVVIPSTITGVALLGINGHKKHHMRSVRGTTLSSSAILANQACVMQFRAQAGGTSHWQVLSGDVPSLAVVTQNFVIAVSDELSLLTPGTAKITFRMPYAFTLTDIKASLVTAATGATLVTVDINEAGVTILSTKLTFDASEKTTTTAATPRVISDTSLAADAEMTIDIDAVGNTTAGKGLKVTLIGART